MYGRPDPSWGGSRSLADPAVCNICHVRATEAILYTIVVDRVIFLRFSSHRRYRHCSCVYSSLLLYLVPTYIYIYTPLYIIHR